MRVLVPLLLLLASRTCLGQDAGPVAVPEASEKAMSYYYTTSTLWVIGVAWGLVVPAVFLFTGWSGAIRDFARRVSPRWAVTILVYFVVFSVLTTLIDLPLSYYSQYVVEHEYGLSEQALSKWITDQAIGLGVSIVIGFIVTLGIYALLRASPRRWWLYCGLAAIPFVLLIFLVEPIWVAPLFNKFGPMKDKAIETKILALAERAGIEGARVFEVEKSVDTKKVNAYVTGVFNTKRIVLWDNILRRFDEKELLFVMGHEMGHYVLHHVWQLLGFLCALIMLALYATHRAAHGLIDRYRERLRFAQLEDIASLPLVTLVTGVVFMVAMPAFNAFSRHVEHQADIFGLEITRDNHAAATAFVRLQGHNLSNPRPNAILHWLRGNHPTPAERIEFANTYRPWETAQALEYADKFKQ
jgi:Zn-dependent protease with chaperone function